MKKKLFVLCLLLGGQISAIDIFDDIISRIEALRSCICTDTQLQTRFQGEAFISTFGENIVGTREDDIALEFQYNIPVDIDVEVTEVGGGTVVQEDNLAKLQTGTGTTASAAMQTLNHLRYRPGHEGYAFFTACFDPDPIATSTQLVGLYDEVDGVAVGFIGTEFGVLYRNDSVDDFILQSEFNIDTLDGMGPSGFDIDTSKINVFRVAYGWLGGAPITLDIMAETGNWITFHQVRRPNMFTKPVFSNPILPMRAEVDKTGSAENIVLKTASWNAGIIGQEQQAGSHFFSATRVRDGALDSTTTENHLITIRNKTNFAGRKNKIEVTLNFASFTSSALSKTLLIRLRKNAVISGLTFTDVDSTNSIIEVSEDDSITGTTTGTVVMQILVPRDGAQFINIRAIEFPISVLPGDTLSVTVQSSTAGPSGTEISSNIGWDEHF